MKCGQFLRKYYQTGDITCNKLLSHYCLKCIHNHAHKINQLSTSFMIVWLSIVKILIDELWSPSLLWYKKAISDVPILNTGLPFLFIIHLKQGVIHHISGLFLNSSYRIQFIKYKKRVTSTSMDK